MPLAALLYFTCLLAPSPPPPHFRVWRSGNARRSSARSARTLRALRSLPPRRPFPAATLYLRNERNGVQGQLPPAAAAATPPPPTPHNRRRCLVCRPPAHPILSLRSCRLPSWPPSVQASRWRRPLPSTRRAQPVLQGRPNRRCAISAARRPLDAWLRHCSAASHPHSTSFPSLQVNLYDKLGLETLKKLVGAEDL